MTFLSNANSPQSGGQVRPEAPEDLLRAMVQRLVQETIQTEFDQFVGAGPYQRSGDRRGWRNGHKPRTFKTRVGKLELRIPQDREGRFQPSVFERYERSEKALVAALIETYVHGVSTRKVSKIVEQLCGHLISASAVSAVTKKLDDEVTAWRRRSLAGKRYRYLIIDAHYEQLRREGSVRSTAVLWVVGIDENGYREHLGLWTGSAESLETWGSVFRDLVDRGVAGMEMTVSDEHLGLVQALKRYFPHAAHQRCTVHYLRNALAHVRRRSHAGGVTRGNQKIDSTENSALDRATMELPSNRGPHQGAALMKRTAKYVGLDVHQATTVASVRDTSGRVIARTILPTEGAALVEFLRGIRGTVRVAFEEGTQALAVGRVAPRDGGAVAR
jgi:transposase-like protein